MAIEDELVSCETCAGIGMKDGEVCLDCRGRGIVRVSHAIVDLPEDEDEEEPPKPLENLSKVQLVELATSMGLDATGKRDDLIERIKAGPLEPPPDVADDPAPVDPEANAVPAPDGPPAELADALADDDADSPADDLDDLNVAQLRERLKEAGLVTTGRRDDLIERLRAG